MKRIVVIGSTMVISGKKIPVPGEAISCGTFLMNPDGKGANQSVAVALVEGMCCQDAIAFAQKAFAISVMRPGAQSFVPFRREK